jgi:hypothetical protein
VASSQEVTPIVRISPPIPMAADLSRSMATQIPVKAEGRQRERRSEDENKYCEVESPAVGAAHSITAIGALSCSGSVSVCPESS